MVTRSQMRAAEAAAAPPPPSYAAQQARQLEADRAMIATYRRAWKEPKGVGHVVLTHVRDVLWWLQHVCGLNMLDCEEQVIVLLVFTAVLVLILLGAYKQGTQLVGMLQQLASAEAAPR